VAQLCEAEVYGEELVGLSFGVGGVRYHGGVLGREEGRVVDGGMGLLEWKLGKRRAVRLLLCCLLGEGKADRFQ